LPIREPSGVTFQASNTTVSCAGSGPVFYVTQQFTLIFPVTDMAIGIAKMFGFDYPENFNYPYVSRSITDFWRRWHMSLSSFFRDYVYIPLGGNRTGHQMRNLLIDWALTGLWHGASWNFVLWGLYYFALGSGKKVNREKMESCRGLLARFIRIFRDDRWALFLLRICHRGMVAIGAMFGWRRRFLPICRPTFAAE
jgi:D-alanyl-lipoteichoic acid acyltransferase DltB (MBOAT superfamily)